MSFIYRQSDPKWFRMYVMNPPPPPLKKGETPPYQEYIISYLNGDENGLRLFLHYYERRVLNNRIIAFIDSNSLPTSAFQDLKQEFMEMLWIELGKYSADEEYSFCYWLKKDYIRVFNEYYLRNHANAGGMDVRTFEKYKAIYAKWRSNLLSDEPLSLEDFLAENNITERMWRNMLLRLSFISLGVKPRRRNDENDEEEQLSAEEMLTAGRRITALMQEVEDEYAKAIDDLREDDIEIHLKDPNGLFAIRAALVGSISELNPRQRRVFLRTIGFDEVKWEFDGDTELTMQEIADTCMFPSPNAASKFFNATRELLQRKLNERGVDVNGVKKEKKRKDSA